MKYLWMVMILLTSARLNAQPKPAMPAPGKWAFRFNPMGLIDVFDGNLFVGLERTLNTRWSLTTDLSFIFYSAYIPENRRTLGYIIKPAIRYYTSDERRLFLEAAIFYKRAGYKLTDWLGKDCVNDVPSYEAYETFIIRKRVAGINLQAGWRRNLTRNNLLHMEIYAGLGFRSRWQDIRDDPRACYEAPGVLYAEINQKNFTGLSLPHGLRLAYVIR